MSWKITDEKYRRITDITFPEKDNSFSSSRAVFISPRAESSQFSQLKTIATTDVPRYFLDSRAFVRIQDREKKEKERFNDAISGFLAFPSAQFTVSRSFLSRVRERLADQPCAKHGWSKFTGRSLNASECRVPAGGNFIRTLPEGTREITVSFVTGCKSPLFDTRAMSYALSLYAFLFLSSFFLSFLLFRVRTHRWRFESHRIHSPLYRDSLRETRVRCRPRLMESN